jgi:hypothetical protein
MQQTRTYWKLSLGLPSGSSTTTSWSEANSTSGDTNEKEEQ